MKKKLLSWLLVVALVITMVPGQAFAAGAAVDLSTDPQEALTQLKSGGTYNVKSKIILPQGDIALFNTSLTLNLEKDADLEINGFLSLAQCDLTIEGSGKLTVNKYVNQNTDDNKINVKGGTIILNGYISGSVNMTGGDMTINSSGIHGIYGKSPDVFYVGAGSKVSLNYSGEHKPCENGATLHVKEGGEFVSNRPLNCNVIMEGGSLSVDGGPVFNSETPTTVENGSLLKLANAPKLTTTNYTGAKIITTFPNQISAAYNGVPYTGENLTIGLDNSYKEKATIDDVIVADITDENKDKFALAEDINFTLEQKEMNLVLCASKILSGNIDITGDVKVGETISADLSHVVDSVGSPRYEWYVGETRATDETGQLDEDNQYKIKLEDKGKTIKLKVIYSNGFLEKVTTSVSGNDYIIRFNGSGATNSEVYEQNVIVGTSPNLIVNRFLKEGYIFKGWSTTVNGTEIAYQEKGQINSDFAQNGETKNLYAVWEKDTTTPTIEDVSGGLILEEGKLPTKITEYKAGNGTIKFTPSVENTVAILELKNAVINAEHNAGISLPYGINQVKFIFSGKNQLNGKIYASSIENCVFVGETEESTLEINACVSAMELYSADVKLEKGFMKVHANKGIDRAPLAIGVRMLNVEKEGKIECSTEKYDNGAVAIQANDICNNGYIKAYANGVDSMSINVYGKNARLENNGTIEYNKMISCSAGQTSEAEVQYYFGNGTYIANPETIDSQNLIGLDNIIYTGSKIEPKFKWKMQQNNEATLSETGWTISYKKDGQSVAEIMDAGNYSAVFKNNVTQVENQVQFVVKPKELKANDIATEISKESLIYDGTGKAPSTIKVKDNVNNIIIDDAQYKVIYQQKVDQQWNDVLDDQQNPIKPINVGTYRIKIVDKIDEQDNKGNYILPEIIGDEFTIEPKKLDNFTIDITGNEEYKYNGNAQYPKKENAVLKDGQTTIDVAFDITYENSKGVIIDDPTTIKEAGTYYIVIKDSNTKDNYELGAGNKAMFKILPKEIDVEKITLDDAKKYNPTDLDVDVKNVTFKNAVTSLNSNDYDAVAVISGENCAGDTTAKVTITLKNKNYIFANNSEVKVVNDQPIKILKSVNTTAEKNISKEFRKKAGIIQVDLTSILKDIDGATIKTDKEISDEGNLITEAAINNENNKIVDFTVNEKTGTATYNIKVNSTNYEEYDVVVQLISVEKDSQKPIRVSANQLKGIFGKKLVLDVLDGSNQEGTVTCVLASNESVVDVPVVNGRQITITPLKSGKATITITLSGNNQYLDTSISYEINIDKAKCEGSPSYTAINKDNMTLTDANLAIGTLKPEDGVIQWVDVDGNKLPDETIVEKDKEYKWQYTPKAVDQDKYDTQFGTIKLYTYEAPTPGGGGFIPTPEPEKPVVPEVKPDIEKPILPVEPPKEGADVGMTEQQQEETNKTLGDIIADIVKPEVKPDPEKPEPPKTEAEKETAATEEKIAEAAKDKDTTIKVEVKTDKIEEAKAPEKVKEEITRIKETMKESFEAAGTKMLQLVNIDVTAQAVKDGKTTDLGKLRNLGKSLTFTIQLPLDVTGNNYAVIRVHDGKAEIIASKYDPITKKITFDTDKFSTYAVVEYDKVATPEPEQPVKPGIVQNIDIDIDNGLFKVTFDKLDNATNYKVFVTEAGKDDWRWYNAKNGSALVKQLYKKPIEKNGKYQVKVIAYNESVKGDASKVKTIYANRIGTKSAKMFVPKFSSITFEKNKAKTTTVKVIAKKVYVKNTPKNLQYKVSYRLKGTKTWKSAGYSAKNVKYIKGLKKGKVYNFALRYRYQSAVDNKTNVYSNVAYRAAKVK